MANPNFQIGSYGRVSRSRLGHEPIKLPDEASRTPTSQSFDGDECIIQEVTIIDENNESRVVMRTAPLPAFHGFYTDLMLGNLALNCQSRFLKEACLSAQNSRELNHVPRSPAKYPWDSVLEEAVVFRRSLRVRRANFLAVAAYAAKVARVAWYERKKRRENNPAGWTYFRRTYAWIEDVTQEEMEQDETEDAKFDAMVRICAALDLTEAKVPSVTRTEPISKDAKQIEKAKRNTKSLCIPSNISYGRRRSISPAGRQRAKA